ncbi:MAG: methyltransferase domain-containing protein [Phycisphaerales bacterium]|nr:MAG: methyltransferase domain-containing protein [Phycisphaerales bacterium]
MATPLGLSARRFETEQMDRPGVDPALLDGAFDDLRTVAALSGVVRRVARPVLALARARAAQGAPPLRVLDVGAGGGELAIGLAKAARRAGVPLHITATDNNPLALERAGRAAAQASVDLDVIEHDAAAQPISAGTDAVVSSLFLHHLDDDALDAFLASLARARPALVVMNDLRRCRRGYALAWLATRCITRNPVVRADGPQSVRAAFTPGELRERFERAGLRAPRVRACWPCRLQAEWSAPA